VRGCADGVIGGVAVPRSTVEPLSIMGKARLKGTRHRTGIWHKLAANASISASLALDAAAMCAHPAPAAAPVTLDRLQTDFDRLAPELAGKAANNSMWAGFQREVGELFVLRDATAPSTRADARVVRARRLLDAGVVDGAIREVAALPGAARAAAWLDDARRYHEARRALDLIETAAILAPTEYTAPANPPARR
jgi:hypothetical protein